MIEESKAKVELTDNLQVKSSNLESLNKHLAMQVRQKDLALQSQLSILEDFKAQIKQKMDMEN